MRPSRSVVLQDEGRPRGRRSRPERVGRKVERGGGGGGGGSRNVELRERKKDEESRREEKRRGGGGGMRVGEESFMDSQGRARWGWEEERMW